MRRLLGHEQVLGRRQRSAQIGKLGNRESEKRRNEPPELVSRFPGFSISQFLWSHSLALAATQRIHGGVRRPRPTTKHQPIRETAGAARPTTKHQTDSAT